MEIERGHSYDKLFNGLSKDSAKSKEILKYFEQKYCREVAVAGLLKCCSVASAQLPDRFHLFVVAPQGQFKSQLDREITGIFNKGMITNIGSDMTIHAIRKMFEKTGIPKTCLIINDYTLLMATKETRSRLRLEGAFAEIMSEGKYTYSDFKESWSLEGTPSIIINMSFEAFNRNKSRMSESTFLDRIFVISYAVNPEIQDNMYSNKLLRFNMKYVEGKPKKIRYRKYQVEDCRNEIKHLGKKYAVRSLQSYDRAWDLCEALVKSHAYLNGREFVNKDDIVFLVGINDIVGNKFSKEGEILETYIMQKNDGKFMGITAIAKEFNRDTEYIGKILFKAKLRGLIADG